MSRSRLTTALGLTLTAMTTLMLELLLMRVLDAIVMPNIAYIVITGAMFAFGLSGVYATLRPLRPGADVQRYLAQLSLGFGVFALLLLPILNAVPVNYGTMARQQPLLLLVVLAVTYLSLVLPFFLSGLIFATAFSEYSREIQSLYFFDLCGAALGCLIIIPFIPLIGPGGLLFVAMALSLVAAVLFLGQLGGLAKTALVAAVVIGSIPFLRSDGYFDFVEKMEKRGVLTARERGDIEVTRWDPIAKIQVVNAYKLDEAGQRGSLRNRLVAYDGGSQSSRLYPFDGNYARLRGELDKDLTGIEDHFWNRSVIASHWLRADSNADVLIIGSAAGQETKGALLYNPGSVDAIEMVGAVVDLSVNRYGDYIGNIFSDPRVNVRVAEGRTFLRGASKKYDIIQIFSNHTSSSIASGSGATYPNYLQTVDAYMEYFSSLKRDGILQVNHHFYSKMIVTAAAAWRRLGRDDFRRHVVVYEQRPFDSIPLLLISMQPWTVESLARLDSFMSRPGSDQDKYFLAENPLEPEASFLIDEAYRGELAQHTIENSPYRVSAPTDNQPFFGFVRRQFGAVAPDARFHLDTSTASAITWMTTERWKVPMDIFHWLATGAAALFFGLVLVLVPLLFSKAGRARWPGEFTSLVYFSCLGAGFIIIELTFIQVFMKFIGYPLYTYTVVLFTMLLAAGLGSQSAAFLGVAPTHRSWIPFAGTLLCGAMFWLLHPSLFGLMMPFELPVRVAAAILMMFPISFFMGMAFPLGILALERKPRGAIAWAWGMNGLFTTVGGIASGLLALLLGFKAALLIGLAIYVIAAVSFRRLGRLANAPAAC